MTMLRAERLRVAYHDAQGHAFAALDVAGLAFASAAFTCVIGPSGCGKSSLLWGLAGIAGEASNSVVWQNAGATIDIAQLSSRARDRFRRENIGFVFQDFQLIGELSPLENVLTPARFDHLRAPAYLRARAGVLLERLRVPQARRRAADLSRGEAQRVALARALLRDPPINLADEPTASLDAAAADTVGEALAALAIAGKLVIAVTHDATLAGRASRVLRLDHGRIVADTAPAP